MFTDLLVWQKAHQLVLDIYKLTKKFPEDEKYGLNTQMRRAAVSVPANIAEGYFKTGKADRLRFVNISRGSLEELRYYLILTKDLDYADPQKPEAILVEVSKLLSLYRKGLQKKQ